MGQANNEPTVGDVALVRAHRRAAEKRAVERSRREYDGILGSPPAWVPAWHVRRFLEIRNGLLETRVRGKLVRPPIIRRWLEEFSRQDEGTPKIPDEFFKEIEDLAHLRWAISLGEGAGLKELGGGDAVRGRKWLAAARKGHAAVHGDAAAKAARYAEYQNDVDSLRAAHPHHSRDRIADLAARKRGVDKKTILRHTNIGPREK